MVVDQGLVCVDDVEYVFYQWDVFFLQCGWVIVVIVVFVVCVQDVDDVEIIQVGIFDDVEIVVDVCVDLCYFFW